MEGSWWTNPKELDESQTAVISLPADGSFLVTGKPGSGKTNLLVLRATYLYAAGTTNIVILTFGRALKEFLASGADNYPFPSDHIQTYMGWSRKTLADNGVYLDKGLDLDGARAATLSGLESIVQGNPNGFMYDCILLDEAQDYSAEEIAMLKKFAKHIFAVGDSNQAIYNKAGGLEKLHEFCELSELAYHYRNGTKICRVADGVKDLLGRPKGLESCSNYDEVTFPCTVEANGNLTIEEQVATMVPKIVNQLQAYPKGLIGVLCPRNREANDVLELLEKSEIQQHIQSQLGASGYSGFSGDKRVILMTTHSSKGLEFRAVHILGMDKIKNFQLQRNLTYTAITRAKTSLNIYSSMNLPGYLDKGLSAIQPPKQPPTIESLFLGASDV